MKPPKTDPPHLQPNWQIVESWNFAWTVTWLIQTTMPRRFLILFPRAELRGWSAVTPGGEKWAVHPHSSALGWNLENRLGIVVCINQETIHAKFQLSTIPQLGCRWGRSVLGGASFSKLGTSVDVEIKFLSLMESYQMYSTHRRHTVLP